MAVPEEVIVGLKFTADTAQAKQQLAELKTSLTDLGSLKGINISQGLTKEIESATMATAKLKTQLEAATNTKTGNLDLTKFNQQLQLSGTTLSQYRMQLSALGPAGQQAFLQLAQAISTAEVPILRVNKLFTNLWENLKRTAGWQISSTAIHAFMGAIQGAYHYAQDLNESLNNIRIVTGQSIDQMSRFAEQANKAAKALSTTTTAYTDAALIYYQQGLDDTAVKERTDVTIKMANVSRQSAEEVSDQMTAVWNNFAKGGENLESFADKMVALGASTASSSEEIASGLEKFAAVSDVVGLSFDYAAAALATVTATTRQSAETVGTAFKTLFARLEGLKLGESLEDGTDLNKYSAALAAIGVNIKDASGELKKMDTILDETGAKWQTLAKDEQMAVAQTVAGVRQYTQFIALMDNWDFFQENLQTEANSAGTLQQQANIYAESWEGAQKRVKAASQAIYSDLIDDQFFIKLTNGLADFLNLLDRLIDTMGGLPGLLATISSIVFNLFSNKITSGIRDIGLAVQNIADRGASARNLQTEAAHQASIVAGHMREGGTEEANATANSYERISALQTKVVANSKNINETDMATYQNLIQMYSAREKENVALAQKLDLLREENDIETELLEDHLQEAQATSEEFKRDQEITQAVQQRVEKEKELAVLQEKQQQMRDNAFAGTPFKNENEYNTYQGNKTLGGYTGATEKLNKATESGEYKQLVADIEAAQAALERFRETEKNLSTETTGAMQEVKVVMDETAASALNLQGILVEQSEQSTAAEAEATAEANKKVEVTFTDLLGKIKEQSIAYSDLDASMSDYQNKSNELGNNVEAQKKAIKDLVESLTEKKLITQEDAEAISNSTTLYEAAKAAKSKLRNEINQEAHSLKNVVRDMQIENSEKNKLIATIDKLCAAYKREGTAQANLTQAQKQGKALYDSISAQVGKSSTQINDYAKAMTSTAQVISGVVMGINAGVNALKNLSNPDMSAWEKFSGLMMALPMVLGGVRSALVGINGINTVLTASTGSLAAMQSFSGKAAIQQAAAETIAKEASDAAAAATGKNIAIKIADVEAVLAGVSADERATIAKTLKKNADEAAKIEAIELALAQSLENSNLDEGSRKAVAHATATYLVKTAKDAETKSIWGKIAAQAVEYWYILVIVAAIAVLATAIYLMVKAYNAEAEALQKANENLKTAQEEAQKTQKAYDDLKNKIDELADKRKALDGLVAGTKEWNEALLEANQAMLDLVETYPELLKFMETDKNGLYVLSDDGEQALQYIQQQKLDAVRTSQINQVEAQKQVSLASANNTVTNVARETSSFDATMITDAIRLISPIGMMMGPLVQDVNSIISLIKGEQSIGDTFKDFLVNFGPYFSAIDKIVETNNLENAMKDVGTTIANDTNLSAQQQAMLINDGFYTLEDGVKVSLEDYLNNATNITTEQTDTLTAAMDKNGDQIKDGLSEVVEAVKNKNAADKQQGEAITKGVIDDQYADVISGKLSEATFGEGENAVNNKYGLALLEPLENILAKANAKEATEQVSNMDDKLADAAGWFGKLSNSELGDAIHQKIKNDEDLMRKYAVASGQLTEEQAASARYKGGWGQGSLSYTSTNGEEIKVESTDEYARNYLFKDYQRQQIAKGTEQQLQQTGAGQQNQIEAQTDAYIKSSNGAMQLEEQYGGNFNDILNNFLTNGQIDITPLLGEVTPEDWAELLKPDDDTTIQEIVDKFNFQELVDSGLIENLDASQFVENGQFAADKFGEAFREELANYKDSYEQLYDQMQWDKAKATAEDASKSFGLDADVLMKQAKQIKKVNEEMKLNAEQAMQMAIANQRMNKGVEALSKNFDDWKKVLTKVDKNTGKINKTSTDYAKALSGMEDAIKDLIGASDDFELPEGFEEMPGILDLVEKASKGNQHAINQLGATLAGTSVEAMTFDKAFESAFNDITNGSADFDEVKANVLAGITDIQNGLTQLEEGVSLDEVMSGQVGSWVESLNQMAVATGMSVDQMNALLNSLGVKAKVNVANVEQEIEVPTYDEYSTASVMQEATYEEVDGAKVLKTPPTWKRTTWTVPGAPKKVKGYTQVAQISTDGSAPEVSYTGVGGGAAGGGVSPSSTGGGKSGGGGKKGGGGSDKTAKPKSKKSEDEKERYHVINKLIEQSKDAYDDLDAAKERAYGAKHLQYLAAEMTATTAHIDLLKEKIKQNKVFIAQDKEALQNSLKFLNEENPLIGVEFDAAGNISNYDAIIDTIVNKYNTAMAAVAGDSDAESDIEEWYKGVIDSISSYEGELQISTDLAKEQAEELRKYLDLQFEGIEYTVEIKIKAEDLAQDFLDFELERVEDMVSDTSDEIMAKYDQQHSVLYRDFNSQQAKAQAAQQAIRDTLSVSRIVTDDEGNVVKDKNGEAKTERLLTDEQVDAFMNGDMSVIKYIEGLENGQQIIDELMEQQGQYQDSLRSMYEDSRAMAELPLQMFNEINDKATKTIERYSDLKDMQTAMIDFAEAAGTRMTKTMTSSIAEAKQKAFEIQQLSTASTYLQVQNNKKVMEDAQASYKVLKEKAAEHIAEQERLAKEAGMDPEKAALAAREAYDSQLKAAKEYFDGVEEAYYESASVFESSLQEAAEAARDAYESVFDSMLKDWESAISDTYKSIEEMQNAFAQKKTLSEQFIPEYQQVYELSKMNRDIIKQIDMTDNVESQRKLKEFQEEIIKLQNSGKKLSEYDLQYLQKRYDLKVAEIALEDAQNAKNQVRLSRDAEGNYSYVYTADESKTTDAAGNYEEKLYQAQDLTEKYLTSTGEQYIQTLAEMSAALAGLKEEDFANEAEYAAKQKEIEDYYTQRLTYFSDQQAGALKNNKKLYEEDYTAYVEKVGNMNTATGTFLMDFQSFSTDFSDTISGQILTSYTSLEDHLTAVLTSLDGPNGLLETSQANYKQYYDNVTGTLAAIGVKVDEEYPGAAESGHKKVQHYLGLSADDYNAWNETSKNKIDEVSASMTTYEGRVQTSFSADNRTAISTTGKTIEGFGSKANTAADKENKLLNAIDATKLSADDLGGLKTDKLEIESAAKNAAGEMGTLGDNVDKAKKNTDETKKVLKDFTEPLSQYKKGIGENLTTPFGDTAGEVERLNGDIKDLYGVDVQALVKKGIDVAGSIKYPEKNAGDTALTNLYQQIRSTVNGWKFDTRVKILPKLENATIDNIKQTLATLGKDIIVDIRPHITAESDSYWGDLNGDGKVTSKDARLALKAAAKQIELTDEQKYRADLTGDGKITSADARQILRTAAKLVSAVPMTLVEDWEAKAASITDPEEYERAFNAFIDEYERTGTWSGKIATGATGMYTGEWGNEGKLAILHEKELVLNQEDTKNILNVVSMVRDLATAIDLSAKAGQIALSGINAGTLRNNNIENQNTSNSIIINAEFPNVNAATEIEAAFNSLELQASQYAYQNN